MRWILTLIYLFLGAGAIHAAPKKQQRKYSTAFKRVSLIFTSQKDSQDF
jgi:hypothetical protein